MPDVIGASETWDSFENPIKMNVEIPGYSYFSSQSHTQNGGVAVYIKSSLTPIPRPDLGKNSRDYESVWIEIENRNGKNYLFVVSIVIQAVILTSFVIISKRFCPIQLYVISKFLSSVILTSTY